MQESIEQQLDRLDASLKSDSFVQRGEAVEELLKLTRSINVEVRTGAGDVLTNWLRDITLPNKGSVLETNEALVKRIDTFEGQPAGFWSTAEGKRFGEAIDDFFERLTEHIGAKAWGSGSSLHDRVVEQRQGN